MNKSGFGQAMAVSILAIPAIMFGWFILTLNSQNSDGGIITTVAGGVLSVMLIAIVLYFATALAWKHREKGKVLVNGAKALFDSSTTGGQKGFWATRLEKWNAKDLENQRWFLYTALAVIAITAVYVTPEKYSEYRFIVGGWIVLLGLHLVIWPFFTEKTSMATKIVITCFILFFPAAVIFPKATLITVENVKKARADFDENFGKATATMTLVSHVPTPYQPQTRVVHQVLHVEPDGAFQTAELPAEQVLGRISWSCPRGCVTEIQHEGDLLCNSESEGVYQGVPCRVVVIGQTSIGAKIYREQFLQKIGSLPINTPRNLMHVSYSFGTIEEIGPVDVKVEAVMAELTRS